MPLKLLGESKGLTLLIIGVVIGAALGYALSCAGLLGAPQAVSAKRLPKKIPVGAIMALKGDLAEFSKKHLKALEMAIEDINKYLKELGLDTQVVLYVEDSECTKEGALRAIQSLAAKKVKIIFGPLSSSELAAIKQFADSNKIIVISHSSTAVSLAIPGDYIFRFVPNDETQAKAITRMLLDKGIKNVVVIYRKDDWGEGLYQLFKKNFEAAGGKVEAVSYDPKSKEYSAEVRLLSDKVKAFGDLSKTAVLLIAFEEDGAAILRLASEDKTLMSVKWFGCDGTARSTHLAKEVGDTIVKLGGLPSTMFVPSTSAKTEEFIKRFKEETGVEPDSYAMNIYDAAWVAILSILEAGTCDTEVLVKVIPKVASRYFGVSGWTLLDENGDRCAGNYEIVKLVEKDGKYTWVVAGVYLLDLGRIRWMEG